MGLRHSELIPQRISRSFDATCAHCDGLAQQLDEVTKDYEACDRECDELMDQIRSLRATIMDLEDELSATRAGHPR